MNNLRRVNNMVTHIGPHNSDICEGWEVRQDPADELFYIYVPESVFCECGCPNCNKVLEVKYHKHTSYANGRWKGEEDPGELYELMEGLQEDFYNVFTV
jgi:hypothetical protein